MGKMKYFSIIRPEYEKSLIYTRMGYQKTKTVLDVHTRELVETGINLAEEICSVHAGFDIVDIDNTTGSRIVMKDGLLFESRDLARFLQRSQKAVLMFASAGSAIIERIQWEMTNGSSTLAVVLDAAASIIVDAGLDWVMKYLDVQLRRTGSKLTDRRFSPGYGDLSLENQRPLYKHLEMHKYGIQLTKTCILAPEKTVIAIAGIVNGG